MTGSRAAALCLVTLLATRASGQGDASDVGLQFEPVRSRPTSAEHLAAGKELYGRYCAQCHGASGDGQGAAAEQLRPRPRDFTSGVFKIRTTRSGELPTDDDLFRSIAAGLPGTAMLSWKPALPDEELWQLVDHVKSFDRAFADYPPETHLVIPTAVSSTPDRVRRGAELYRKVECTKCHGEEGRGDGPMAAEMTDDWGQPIRPADLTKPWRFRGGAEPGDILRTLVTGIGGTPMPSFADTNTSDELWDLVHFVRSIGRTQARSDELRATRSDTLPTLPFAEQWHAVPAADFPLVGDAVTPFTIDMITVKALHDDQELVLLLAWNDPSSDPAEGRPTPDQVAVLLGIGPGPPAEGEADSWRWSSDAAAGTTQIERGADQVRVGGVHRHGQYRVLLRRSFASGDVPLAPGKHVRIAFQVWNGANPEGTRRASSAWYDLHLEPAPSSPPIALAWLAALVWPGFLAITVLSISTLGWFTRSRRES